MSNVIPEGFMKNSSGNLIRIENVREIDILRNEIVIEMVQKAKELQEHVALVKQEINQEVSDFIELSADEYGVKIGGDKGNVTLTSYDGEYQIVINVNEYITHDERLNIAKKKIDQCLLRWGEGANHNLATIVNSAFRVDKKSGSYDARRIAELQSYDIDDPEWNEAMKLISESRQVSGSKEYTVFRKKNQVGKYQQIPLDFSAL